MTLRIATRASPLALSQTQWVADRLVALRPGLTVELVRIRTEGDRILDRPLAEFGGKGVFVKEIEEALLDGRADLAVHSLKDMPADLPAGLAIRAYPPREDPRDALVLPTGAVAEGPSEIPLPHGATVGNSSLRRQAQLLALRPDLRVEPIRGNVDTRLRKLDEGEFDAILLAAAGLRRLGMTERISVLLDPTQFVPAPGQGTLAIEGRREAAWQELLEAADSGEARVTAVAERTLMERLGGDCLTPLGAFARVEGDLLHLFGMVALPDGTEVIREHSSGPRDEPGALADVLADRILSAGGNRILASLLITP